MMREAAAQDRARLEEIIGFLERLEHGQTFGAEGIGQVGAGGMDDMGAQDRVAQHDGARQKQAVPVAQDVVVDPGAAEAHPPVAVMGGAQKLVPGVIGEGQQPGHVLDPAGFDRLPLQQQIQGLAVVVVHVGETGRFLAFVAIGEHRQIDVRRRIHVADRIGQNLAMQDVVGVEEQRIASARQGPALVARDARAAIVVAEDRDQVRMGGGQVAQDGRAGIARGVVDADHLAAQPLPAKPEDGPGQLFQMPFGIVDRDDDAEIEIAGLLRVVYHRTSFSCRGPRRAGAGIDLPRRAEQATRTGARAVPRGKSLTAAGAERPVPAVPPRRRPGRPWPCPAPRGWSRPCRDSDRCPAARRR